VIEVMTSFQIMVCDTKCYLTNGVHIQKTCNIRRRNSLAQQAFVLPLIHIFSFTSTYSGIRKYRRAKKDTARCNLDNKPDAYVSYICIGVTLDIVTTSNKVFQTLYNQSVQVIWNICLLSLDL